MTLKTLWVAIPVVLMPFVTGCSPQPLAPSQLPAADLAVNAASATSAALAMAAGGRAATTGVVYVTSQGLYYDTFVTRDPLPMKGKFQLLVNGTTEFGPGDREYLGGRWWEDLNGNAIQDSTDHYFLCPLLPPGRPTP
jgi:hypothetical protein